jgi:hypothetical protein
MSTISAVSGAAFHVPAAAKSAPPPPVLNDEATESAASKAKEANSSPGKLDITV